MIREIIILAKSSKHGQYCIAGIDKSSGEWIRPISTDNGYKFIIEPESI